MNISGNHAHFAGMGRVGKRKGVSFTVDVTDNGTPGTLDTFSLQVGNGYSPSVT